MLPQPIAPTSTRDKGRASVFTLQAWEIVSRWNELEPLIARSLPDEWSTHEARELIESGKAQVWGIASDHVEGVWITKIENTQSARWGLVWLCAGNFEPFKDYALMIFRDYIEPWFKAQGCQSVRIIGRRGWLKLLPDYHERTVTIEKCLL